MVPLILASNSPRRRELLSLVGLPFIILPVDVDETPLPGEKVADCVLRLSELKARAARDKSSQMGLLNGQVILASDTLVVNDQEILGKPKNAKDARRMLELLRGHTHQVITGIALTTVGSSDLVADTCITDVPMRNYSDAEIEAYIQSGDPMDKAGAYAIQHVDFHPVEHMTGCYASVMGLPLCHIARNLTKFDIQIFEDVPTACQGSLNYECPVFESILEPGGPE